MLKSKFKYIIENIFYQHFYYFNFYYYFNYKYFPVPITNLDVYGDPIKVFKLFKQFFLNV